MSDSEDALRVEAHRIYSEPVTDIAFGADLEPGDARPSETSHWIGDDPIGFTWRDGDCWAASAPYTGQDTTGFATEADAIAELVKAHARS